MSRSPSEPSEFSQAFDPRSAYRRQLDRLEQLLESGGSLSGNERNCAFLNIGPQPDGSVRFATISAVSGLDFLDDGRAHALVDWDGDGDLDVWSMNRTAPRVRMLRNDQSSGQHFLAIRLIGRTCNRDAIGARVEVVLDDADPSRRLARSLRAGEGFLAQSTKWLHFGLGKFTRIKRVVVHWPGGATQEVRGIECDSHYEITQGTPTPVTVNRLSKLARLEPAELALPAATSEAQVLLTSRIPLPAHRYEDFDSHPRDLEDLRDAPLLVNLWATWCVPCRAEMDQFVQRSRDLKDAGVRILALSVDGLAAQGGVQTSPADARKLLETMEFPFLSGAATAESVRRWQFVNDLLFGHQRQLPVPTSFLLDRQGRLAAVYRGPVSVDRLVEDVAKLTLDEKKLSVAALPFPGTWYDARRRFAPMEIPADLAAHGFEREAAEYIEEHLPEIKGQPGFPQLAGHLGDRLARQSQMEPALRLYRAALAVDPDNVPLMNNLAWYLATHSDARFRNGAEAIQWAEKAAQKTRYQAISILDTLAAAYAEGGQPDKAVATVHRAIELAKAEGRTELLENLTRSLHRYKSRD